MLSLGNVSLGVKSLTTYFDAMESIALAVGVRRMAGENVIE